MSQNIRTVDRKDKKYRLLVKPCQSSKTGVIVDTIRDAFSARFKNGKYTINLIICDNSTIQVAQLCDRLLSDRPLSDTYTRAMSRAPWRHVLELSSASTQDSDMEIRDVRNRILSQDTLNIVTCCNSLRIGNISKLLSVFRDNRKFVFDIWLDEGDKLIHSHCTAIHKWTGLSNVASVTFVTSTPISLFDCRTGISEATLLRVPRAYQPALYSGVLDCRFTDCTSYYRRDDSHEQFIRRILNNNAPRNGQVWFIPAAMTCDDHMAVANTIKNLMPVLIVNGQGMTLVTSRTTKDVSDFFKNTVVKDGIAKMYHELDLKKLPFAITGRMCVTRGITLSSNTCCISHAIMPALPSASLRSSKGCANAYQLVGRVCGNSKKFLKYRTPQLYATLLFYESVLASELLAIKLARLSNKFRDPVVVKDSDIGVDCIKK